MSTVWFVTSLNYPNKFLDGPFIDREECNTRCVNRTSESTKQKIIEAVLSGTDFQVATFNFVPYVPRPCDSSIVPTQIIVRDTGATANPAPVLASSDLIARLRSLPRSKLLKIAHAIGFNPPESLITNKAALATRIHTELRIAFSYAKKVSVS